MFLRSKLTALSVLLLSLRFTPTLPAQNPVADLLIIHGHILTLDANDSAAQAIAVRRGVIVKVGTDAEVLEFAGRAPGLRIIDLNGRTATPALSTHTPTLLTEVSKKSTQSSFRTQLRWRRLSPV